MFRTIAFLSRKPGLTLLEFRRHYEDHHVPLVLSMAQKPVIYERRYIDRERPMPERAEAVDFDVITEVVFEDAAAFERGWLEPLIRSAEAHRIAEDEETFIDRARTRSYSFVQSE